MKLKSWFTGAAAAFLMTATAEAQKVSITYADGTKREADCSVLYIEDGKLYMTREAAQELDYNHTPIGLSVTALSKDKQERQKQLSNNLYLFLVHVARQHKDCVMVTAKLEEKIGVKDVDAVYTNLYGPDWREKMKGKGCTVIDFREKCKEELNLK